VVVLVLCVHQLLCFNVFFFGPVAVIADGDRGPGLVLPEPRRKNVERIDRELPSRRGNMPDLSPDFKISRFQDFKNHAL